MKMELFMRNMARAFGKATGYGTGIAVVIWFYRWLGVLPFHLYDQAPKP